MDAPASTPSTEGRTFISTREGKRAAFWQSVVQGSAEDGGLLVPEGFHRLPNEYFTTTLPQSSTDEIATQILRPYIPVGAIDDADLSSLTKTALHFPLPLEEIDSQTFVLRLDQGPTASFKDIAARVLAQLMERHCAQHQQRINLLVATSGDTGVAIADAFGGSKWMTVTILYPESGVSPVQERQMLDTDKRNANVQSLPVNGNFDYAQDISKILQSMRGLARRPTEGKEQSVESLRQEIRLKLGEELSVEDILEIAQTVDSLNLSSANSINIWRLLPQMTQYFAGYAQMVRAKKIQPGQDVVFSVPSGNIGHLMAGIYAKEMGLPIKRFVAGTNANNIFASMIGHGMLRHKGFVNTSSPSMDILDPSNLERLLTYAAQKTGNDAHIDYVAMKNDIKHIQVEIQPHQTALAGNPDAETRLMHERELRRLRIRPGIPLSTYGVTQKMLVFLQELIWTEDIVDDEDILEGMMKVQQTTDLVMEPHGTTALLAAQRSRKTYGGISKSDPVVVFETAHPQKFPESLELTGLTPPPHPTIEALLKTEKPAKRPAIQDLRDVAKRINDLMELQH